MLVSETRSRGDLERCRENERQRDRHREKYRAGEPEVRVLLPVPTPPPGPSPSPQCPQPPSLFPTPFSSSSSLYMSPRIIQVLESPSPWSLALSLGCWRTWAGLNIPLPNEHSFSPGLQRSKVAALFTHSHALPAPLLSSFFIMETAQWPQAPWETTPHLPSPRPSDTDTCLPPIKAPVSQQSTA